MRNSVNQSLQRGWTITAVVIPLLIGVAWAAVALSPPDFDVSRGAFVLSCVIFMGIVAWSLILVEWPSWARLTATAIVGAAVAVGLVEGLRWLANREALAREVAKDVTDRSSFVPISRFAITTETVISGPALSPFAYRYTDRYGAALVPISILLKVRMTNVSNVPCNITAYAVDAEVNGRWHRLLSIPQIDPKQLFFSPPVSSANKVAQTFRIEFDSIFDTEASQLVAPGHSLRGWMLYELPPDLKERHTIQITRFRFNVEDSLGSTQQSVVEGPASRLGSGARSFAGGGFRTKEITDLSHIPFRSPIRP